MVAIRRSAEVAKTPRDKESRCITRQKDSRFRAVSHDVQAYYKLRSNSMHHVDFVIVIFTPANPTMDGEIKQASFAAKRLGKE